MAWKGRGAEADTRLVATRGLALGVRVFVLWCLAGQSKNEDGRR